MRRRATAKWNGGSSSRAACKLVSLGTTRALVAPRRCPISSRSRNSLWLKAHHQMGAMGLGKRFSFALERDDVCARGWNRLRVE